MWDHGKFSCFFNFVSMLNMEMFELEELHHSSTKTHNRSTKVYHGSTKIYG